MFRWVLGLLTICLMASLQGCSSGGSVQQYAENTPVFDVHEYFSGELSAHGVVKNRAGDVIRTFNAELNGSMDGDELLLKERFVFDDGEIQFRDWRIDKDTKSATAGDVIGPATLSQAGNALFIRYTLAIPYNDDIIHVNVDDRMYRVSDAVVINQSVLTKWGFEVGEVLLSITKM